MMKKPRNRTASKRLAAFALLSLFLTGMIPAVSAEEDGSEYYATVEQSIPALTDEQSASQLPVQETVVYADPETTAADDEEATSSSDTESYESTTEESPTAQSVDTDLDAEKAINESENETTASEIQEEIFDLDIYEDEILTTRDNDVATDMAVNAYGVSLHPEGEAPRTLGSDDVTGSVAEAGYFPSKRAILHSEIPGVFTASMIVWHKNNGAACYRIKDTTIFAGVFDGAAIYTPQPGDLIYYQAYKSEYDQSVITSGNSNWLHAGIVYEVGNDYITTIEGNAFQSVNQLTFTTAYYGGGMADFAKTWIVNVFGSDDLARSAFVKTAEQAWQEAQEDAYYDRVGFSSWCESKYNDVYQNDTIASGYFYLPAAWCEMFVLWCAFHADMPEPSVRYWNLKNNSNSGIICMPY